MRITYYYLNGFFILCFCCLFEPSYSASISEKTITNNYEITPLPENCDSVPCSKKTLLQAFRKLQLKNFDRNYDIPARSHDKNTLRTVTYNVHYWQDAAVKTFSASNNASGMIIDEIVEMDADVYLLQEVVFKADIISLLLKKLNIPDGQHYFCRETGNNRGLYPVGNLTLFRMPLKPLYTDRYYYFPQKTTLDYSKGVTLEKSAHGRCAIINTFIPEGTNSTFQLVNLHLDHTDDSRHKHEQLEGVLKKMAKDPYLSQIDHQLIGGDFNIPMARQLSDEKQQALLQDARLRKTDINLHVLELLEHRGFIDSFDHSGIAPPGGTTWSLVRIDYLFLKSLSSRRLHFAGQYLFHTLNSDHNPLIFDMKLTPSF